jgi:hypothetical protein
VPKVLSKDQTEKKVETSAAFFRMIYTRRSFLSNIITMDKSAMSVHTPKIKTQSKQWLEKYIPGPLRLRSLSQPNEADGPCLHAQQGDGAHQLHA